MAETPRPKWEIFGDNEQVEGVPCITISYGEYGTSEWTHCCDVAAELVGYDFVLTDAVRERAALIVRAVNGRAALRAALEGMIGPLEHAYRGVSSPTADRVKNEIIPAARRTLEES